MFASYFVESVRGSAHEKRVLAQLLVAAQLYPRRFRGLSQALQGCRWEEELAQLLVAWQHFYLRCFLGLWQAFQDCRLEEELAAQLLVDAILALPEFCSRDH